MNKYEDLEGSIISCIIQRPELIEKINGKENYFIKYKKLILFLQAVYKKFGVFNLDLLFNVCKQEYKLLWHIEWLAQLEPAPSQIDLYIQELEELRTELKKDKWIREKIYSLASELYIKNITIPEFNSKLEQIYKDSEKIFKE
jgi:hypothetical protein